MHNNNDIILFNSQNKLLHFETRKAIKLFLEILEQLQLSPVPTMRKKGIANITETSQADSSLQVAKVVQLMIAKYPSKRKPCSDSHTMRVIWSGFLKTHLKTKGVSL